MKITDITQTFQEIFKSSPLIIRSPGRINLIGEHTDYNEGFVLPAAIDKEIYLALGKNGTDDCRIFSYDYKEMITFCIKDFSPAPNGWINYVMGVVAQVLQTGPELEGFDCVFGGDIPIGAGLSSSAALENGVCYGLSELFELKLDRISMLKYSQKAEHEFAGVACGIMDQFASMMGKSGHAIRLDCRSLDFIYFPLKMDKYLFILCDSQVQHSLVDTEYNARRKECEAGVAAVKKHDAKVKSLRDVSLEMLDKVKQEVSPVVFKRCLYVLEENERLLKGCQLLKSGNLKEFGRLMYGSHEGLSKQYEVSCPELDFLVEFTYDRSDVLGARMMGGGFGGCTINLVNKEHKEAFIPEITEAYNKGFGHDPKIYEVSIVDGTSRIH
ncbi:MAG: galactokinase [Anditalea sp.]